MDDVFHRVNEDGSLTALSGPVSAVDLREVSEPLHVFAELPTGQQIEVHAPIMLEPWQWSFLVDVLDFNGRQMRTFLKLLGFGVPTRRQRRIAQVSTRKYRARRKRR